MSTTSDSINMFETTRMGRVIIAMEAIKYERDAVLDIMRQMIPIATTIVKDADIIEYLAISDHFDALKANEKIPVYTTQIHSDGHVSFIRTTFKVEISESTQTEIVKLILEHKVDLDKFKAFVLQYTKATEEDFTTYDDSFLEALRIYIARTKG